MKRIPYLCRIVLPLLMLLFCVLLIPASGQTLFEQSQASGVRPETVINDGGALLRGKPDFNPNALELDSTYSGRGRSTGMCTVNLETEQAAHYTEIPEQLLSLLESLGTNDVGGFQGSLERQCEVAPTACDIAKQIFQATQFRLEQQQSRCQNMMTANPSLTQAALMVSVQRCISSRLLAGERLPVILNECTSGGSVEGVGVTAAEEGVLRGLLEAVAPEGMLEFILGFSGDFSLTLEEGQVVMAGARDPYFLLRTYQTMREEMVIAVATVASAIASGSAPEGSALATISGPGSTASGDALLAIGLESDTALRDAEVARYGGNIAYSKIIWQLSEAASALESAVLMSDATPQLRAHVQSLATAIGNQSGMLREMRESLAYVTTQSHELIARHARKLHEAGYVANQAGPGQGVGSGPVGITVSRQNR